MSAVLVVDDMSCGHCVRTIEDALRDGMPGVPVSVDLGTRRVTVAGDAAQAEALIRDAGYEQVRQA